MNGQAITFDFHNTIAACPEWFELEVRRLPSAFLRWWAGSRSAAISDATLTGADERYHQLRRDIMDHGNEMTAEDSLHTVFAAMGIEVPARDIDAGVETLMREALAGASPIPGAIETVNAIHQAGVAIGVVSSAVYHPFLEWTLGEFGIRDDFRAVVTSASAGFYKSRPEIYQHAAIQIGAEPARMVHIGDSLRFDVDGARRAGMGTVWLQHAEQAPEDAVAVPDLTLRTLEGSGPEILRLLESRSAHGEAASERA